MPAATLHVDEAILKWATPHQRRVIESVNEHMSQRGAAKALGMNKSTVQDAVRAAYRRAAIKGWSPAHNMTRTVPDPFIVRGVSTYYNKDGQPAGQWVKSRLDDERLEEIVRATVADLTDGLKGLAPITKAPKSCDADLLSVYPMGDPHFGMYAWAKEAGDDFDVSIASELTLSAVDRLVQSGPESETAIFLPLGDVLHMDDQSNQTPGHKHQLDADGRFVKVLGVAIQSFRHSIIRLLEKHKRVIVRFKQGNHDPHAVWAIAYAIAAYFESEPRVDVDLSPARHWFYRFGKVLIGATHGDQTKHRDLLGVMAGERPEDWGATKHRYFYTGHVHSQTVTELPGLLCESFRTLAARDAWAAGMGYLAGRDMRLIVHHREHGEIERHRCDVGMIRR